MTIEQKFQATIAVIEQAGQLAWDYFDTDQNANEIKADGSEVTLIDKAIEADLVSFVREMFPEDSIIGEEGSGYEGTSGYVWHIDPIDGTDNFMRKIPFCAISVARLGDTHEGSFGIIHNPITKQTYAALMNNGVYEREKVHVMNNEILGNRITVAVSYGRERWMKVSGTNIMRSISLDIGKGVHLASCALELAYIAANRIDGQLSYGLSSWDYAAGLYLAKVSGGNISVFEDGMWQKWTKSIKELCTEHGRTFFVSHAGIHQQLLDHIGDPQTWCDRK